MAPDLLTQDQECTVASASNLRIAWNEPAPTASAGLSLEALPCPAAILDSRATIQQTNRGWLLAHPTCGLGQPFSVWCGAIHKSASELSAALLEGAQRVLSQGEPFLQRYGDGDRYLVTISACQGGALVLHQDLSPAPERVRAQKMETMGRLMAGVAHDFANVITLIDGYTDILLNRMPSEDPQRIEMEEIRKAASHGAGLTRQLLGFTRGQDLQPAPLDLNLLVGEMQRMLRPIIGEYIALETSLAPNLEKVVADLGQMEQVVVNLVLNARDAMPRGGRITISTANCEFDDAAAARHGVAPGRGVALSIADTGSGIAAETLPRVFEPFFTTKGNGRGTGLGLSTVRDIVQRSGGIVWAHSAPNEGATFTVWLPTTKQAAGNAAGLSVVPPTQPGHETILLVEDEDTVRRLLAHLLERRGYRVLQAANAEDAIELFAARASEIHLVLTDIIMPGMSGRALAERLRDSRPETRVVFMSGYTNDVLARTGALSAGMSFLQKPLRPEVLAAKIREALDSPSRPFNPR